MARRLVVALTACALVWRIQRERSPQGAAPRAVLVPLSGRQQRHGGAASALLAGLGVLLAMLEVLQDHSVEELRQLCKFVLDTTADSG